MNCLKVYLSFQYLEAPEFRNMTLKCLAEITSLSVGPEYDLKFIILSAMVTMITMTSVNRMIQPTTNVARAYADAADGAQELILLFFANLLTNHVRIVETEQNRDVLLNAQIYMVKTPGKWERDIQDPSRVQDLAALKRSLNLGGHSLSCMYVISVVYIMIPDS